MALKILGTKHKTTRNSPRINRGCPIELTPIKTLYAEWTTYRRTVFYTFPFLFFWKNVLTTNTWNPLSATMRILSTMENQIILDSVDLTVEKLRFSLVRKYFWVRAKQIQSLAKDGGKLQIVDNCPESLKNVSSSLSGDSLDEAAFVGS